MAESAVVRVDTSSTSPDPAAPSRGVMAESGVARVETLSTSPDLAALWRKVMIESGVVALSMLHYGGKVTKLIGTDSELGKSMQLATMPEFNCAM